MDDAERLTTNNSARGAAMTEKEHDSLIGKIVREQCEARRDLAYLDIGRRRPRNCNTGDTETRRHGGD